MPGDREGIHRRLRPRGGAEPDEGFVLLESIIAIALITVLMVGLTSLFISAMQSTAHQRATQGAVRIATDQIDQIRGLGYSGALSGRDKGSVRAQFDIAPESVLGWLSARTDQAFSGDAAPGAGRIACGGDGSSGPCATLPTTPVVESLNNIDFAVSYYEEWCYRNAADKTTAGCVPASDRDGATTYNQYLRVVVEIAWSDSSCPVAGCSYLSSLLLNGTAEPTFYFNDQPPPKPDITGCTPPAVAVGDRFSSEDQANPALQVIGTDGFCGFDGGVPTFTWRAMGLPAGLAMQSDGSIIGEPTTAGTVTGITLTVTDAFLIQGTSPAFSWKVYPRLELASIPGHTDTQNVAISTFTASASGGQGSPYTYSATGLPPGITLSSSGTFSGTPTRVGSYQPTVTVTDVSGTRSVSRTFAWDVTYPPLTPVSPATQVSTVGAAIRAITLTAGGGSGRYEYSDPEFTLPAGLTLTSNQITGVPTGAGDYPVTLTVTDDTAGTTATVTFTWNVNPAPSVLPPPNTTTAPGGAVTGQAVGSEGTPGYSFALQNAPDWMHIDPHTGELSGTASDQIADYPNIVITLTDSKGAVAQSAPFTWSVYEIPTLVAPGDQTSDFGDAISLQLQATCVEAPCTYSMTGNPDWLRLDPATGLITGDAPDTEGLFTGITVSISDKRGSTASSQFSWVVGPSQTITSPGDQIWTVGQPLTNDSSVGLQVTADCRSRGPCSFSLAPGSASLPQGLTLSKSGLITGKPGAAGRATGIVIRATNTAGHWVDAASFTWTINPRPTLSQPNNQRSAPSATVLLPLSADCRSTPCTFSSDALPDGLSLDPTSGLIHGTTGAAGVWPITVNVTDKTGAVASRDLTWYVVSIGSIPEQSLRRSDSLFGFCFKNSSSTFSLDQFVVGRDDSTSLAYSMTGPSWVTLRGSQLTITAPCSTSNTNTVTVSVTASGGGAQTVTVPQPPLTISFNIRVTS